MKTRHEIKQQAYAALNGKWSKFVIMSLVYSLIYVAIVAVCDGVSIAMGDGGEIKDNSLASNVLTIVANILLVPLGWAYTVIFLRNIRNASDTKTSNLFDGYSDFGRIVITYILVGIYVFLWTLLLVIPGIVKYYSYSMTPYVLHDNPSLRNNKAIERSMELMKGNKMRLFILDLSFIGWFLLGLVTFCIGFLWVYPYWLSARAAFYEDLLANETAKIQGETILAEEVSNIG